MTARALAGAAGDPDAVDDLVRGTHRDVWRFVAYLTDVQSADDLTQETYLRAWTALPRFTGASSVRTWLLSIARRTVVDRYRAASARPRTVSVEDWVEVAERRQDITLPGFDEGFVLADLCRVLDPARREAFVLTQVLDLGYAEAAGVVGCPIGTVRSRVARARDDLVTLLREAERGAFADAGVDTGVEVREVRGRRTPLRGRVG
ncbi:sigma-70 family RNA polymerase sigma factor [Streptomyces sp. SID3343]|uniref:sigma-70 family RNA polymerase sigma factor n=1 Tax=Streptomyces sp. SID3343 TaxID=2690260 RepID=UPI00136E8303|nr:sigma-70 family RNA polymerase sigma factor [Streptomyces sp. SID3343]MYW03011.1 sigma-70 family RNA polymerase sigma factor [Streptomyces sp. SID3343]